jgi:cAMP phosphodiesterase
MHRDKHYKKRYGLTAADVDAMAAAQNNQCTICTETVARLVVDHCHKHGHVRALLCNSCNTGLGHFKDNPELLHAAADYIRKHANEENRAY